MIEALRAWTAGLLTPSGVWSLVTMAVSVVGLWLAGHEPSWGWWYGIGCQVVWTVEGTFTHRPGDIILSVVFAALYVRNIRRNRGASYRQQRDLSTRVAELEAELAACRRLIPAGVS